MHRIIGLTGTNGAGKDTAAEYLSKKLGFQHFSVREYIVREIYRHKEKVDRDTTRKYGNKICQEHGSGFIVEQLYVQALAAKTDAVIESIRRIGEADFIIDHGATLIAIDAAPEIRYERIRRRNSQTDQVSYETFLEQERAEMASVNPYEQNVGAVVQMAHHRIINNGSLEELYVQLDELFVVAV